MKFAGKSEAVDSSDDGLPVIEVGPWAEKKYGLVQLYQELFATGMKNKWQNLIYVDLFSGPGKVRVRGTNKILLGSPPTQTSNPSSFAEIVMKN
jgi:hypothetical protein